MIRFASSKALQSAHQALVTERAAAVPTRVSAVQSSSMKYVYSKKLYWTALRELCGCRVSAVIVPERAAGDAGDVKTTIMMTSAAEDDQQQMRHHREPSGVDADEWSRAQFSLPSASHSTAAEKRKKTGAVAAVDGWDNDDGESGLVLEMNYGAMNMHTTQHHDVLPPPPGQWESDEDEEDDA